ncbi:MAG: polymerase subunit delta [Bacteroidota bacterium]
MGDEPYFIDVITDYMEDHILGEAEKSFCQAVLYGRDVNMDGVIGMAKGYPMMGDRQLIIVKEAQDMKEWKKDDELKVLENYLTNPTPTTLLVFAFKGKGLDKRKKLYKSIDKYGVVFESEPVRDTKLPAWIEAYVNEKGYKINHDASNLLAEYLGSNLSKVVNEVNKLAILLPPGSVITTQVIEDNIGISKDYNVWELQKALYQKDALKANRIINYFEANPKNNPIQQVIPSIYSSFIKVLMFHGLKNKNDAAKELGIPPFAIAELKQTAALFSPTKLEHVIRYLRDADKKSKGIGNVSISEGDILREVVFKIIH